MQMEIIIQENGKMGKGMEMVNLLVKMVESLLENGKMMFN
jgi:hypothetical protein